jgi:NAD+ kinase
MLTATVKRGGKPIFRADALNEISIQSLLGVVRLTVSIDDHPLQFIHGGGIMVSTPTGSTGYNLSAHGPIVTPDIHCLILTEILDHHIPTPPMMVKQTKTICITITEMRKLNILSLRATGESANVILMADNANLFVLEEGDSIELRKSPKTIKFAELEHGYFFKSLQEKFAYR